MNKNNYVVLEDKINFENAHEDNDLTHPLEDFTFEEIKELMTEVESKYPGYDSYWFEKCSKSYGYGARTGWYELRGNPTELAKEMGEDD